MKQQATRPPSESHIGMRSNWLSWTRQSMCRADANITTQHSPSFSHYNCVLTDEV